MLLPSERRWRHHASAAKGDTSKRATQCIRCAAAWLARGAHMRNHRNNTSDLDEQQAPKQLSTQQLLTKCTCACCQGGATRKKKGQPGHHTTHTKNNNQQMQQRKTLKLQEAQPSQPKAKKRWNLASQPDNAHLSARWRAWASTPKATTEQTQRRQPHAPTDSRVASKARPTRTHTHTQM
jgi:hypothetical protein